MLADWRDDGKVSILGSYRVEEIYPGTRLPWLVSLDGRPARRRHGTFSGYQRFGSRDSAKRWVEKQGFFRKTRGRWSWVSFEGDRR